MIDPLPLATIGSSAARVSRRTAVTSTSSMYCSSSMLLWRNDLLRPNPALLTSRSTGRSGSLTRASTIANWSRLPRSATITSTLTPYFSRSSAASFSNRSCVRDTSTRSRPALARAKAKDRPMPEVGPVMTAVGLDMRPASRAMSRSATRLRHDGGVPAKQPRILAVANQKGGVAKTTTVASLGAALAELGAKVLLVDLDPQACLTFSLGIDPEDLELSVHHVLTKGLDPHEVIIETEDGVDLLPATIELARAEADLLTRTGREHVVKLALEDLRYDWVLLDCPPSLGVLTVAALTAGHGVLIPLQCETLSHRGVGQLLDTVHDVRRFTNPELEVWGVLPTLYDGRTNHARAVLENISETYRLDVLEPPIPKSIRFAEAPAAGRSILRTTRHHRGADAYRAVAASLQQRGR